MGTCFLEVLVRLGTWGNMGVCLLEALVRVTGTLGGHGDLPTGSTSEAGGMGTWGGHGDTGRHRDTGRTWGHAYWPCAPLSP